MDIIMFCIRIIFVLIAVLYLEKQECCDLLLHYNHYPLQTMALKMQAFFW